MIYTRRRARRTRLDLPDYGQLSLHDIRLRCLVVWSDDLPEARQHDLHLRHGGQIPPNNVATVVRNPTQRRSPRSADRLHLRVHLPLTVTDPRGMVTSTAGLILDRQSGGRRQRRSHATTRYAYTMSACRSPSPIRWGNWSPRTLWADIVPSISPMTRDAGPGRLNRPHSVHLQRPRRSGSASRSWARRPPPAPMTLRAGR